MTLNQMRRMLAERGIQLTKSLGQNFLHDGNQLRRIVDAAKLAEREQVLEIGPGLGPLTELLLARAGRVLAIEKDLRLVRVLQERFATVRTLELVHADALDYLRTPGRNWIGWKVVSNLPYAVASPILVELAQRDPGPERMVVTVQSEVARRVAAGAGEKEYGILTLLLGVHYQVNNWFKVPASCFFPVPDVDSACVVLGRRSIPLVPASSLQTYQLMVKQSFSQRRKMMLKLLRTRWPAAPWEPWFEAVGLPPTVRAEEVTPGQFAALTDRLFAGKESADDRRVFGRCERTR